MLLPEVAVTRGSVLCNDKVSHTSPKHDAGSNPNVSVEPPIESTDVFITSWLSGGSPSSFCDKSELLPTQRTLLYNDMSPMSTSRRNSFILDTSVSKSFDDETPTSPQSSNRAQTLSSFQSKDFFEINKYRDIQSTESFDSSDSHLNRKTNINTLLSSKRSHQRDSSIPSRTDRIESAQGRIAFTGSPILEHDESLFMHHSLKDYDPLARYTSKVRKISLEDRPHQRLHPHFSVHDGFTRSEEVLPENNIDLDKKQLFSRSSFPTQVETQKMVISDFAAEVSPKDIFAFPGDLEMTNDEGDVPEPTCPTPPPFDNVTPVMTKKELKLSPIPPLKRSSHYPSSPNTPSIRRKAQSRSMYEDIIHGSSSPFAHPDRTTIVDPRMTESRFNQDFEIIGTLGDGSFGTVYKCLSRLDGCTYAIKAAKKIARGATDLDRMLREVRSLAALSDLTDPAAFHIVRYHQAWLDDRRLFIQTELCTSTLSDEMKVKGPIAHDTQRRFKLLREMCLALDLIHRKDMVHLDIKPENIFIKNDQYKLGDFGLVNKTSVRGEVDEEGDSRYMAKDLLSGYQLDLTKCDIFSLGVTMYEVCSGEELPLDGQGWHDLRDGKLPALPHTHVELYGIIKDMMNPEPLLRPSASSLLQRRQLLSEEQKKLILEQNKVREANLALKHQEARYLQSPPKKTLMRSHTWNGVR